MLLHVPDSLDHLWAAVTPPAGYTKWRSPDVKSDKRSRRLAPNVPTRTEPVWLAFDPEHGRGQRPDKLWGRPNLAASEVLSALVQFPTWCLTWFNGAPAPNLASYQLNYDADWSRVPCLYRWGDDRRLELDCLRAVHDDSGWASPFGQGVLILDPRTLVFGGGPVALDLGPS